MYKISEDNKTIVLEKAVENATYEEFVSSLPENEPRYALYDFEFEKPGEGQRSKIAFFSWYALFLFYFLFLSVVGRMMLIVSSVVMEINQSK